MSLPRLYGRQTELQDMRSELHLAVTGSPRLLVMYGRRRVGKTFLLQHFGESISAPIEHVYFAATQDPPAMQRANLAKVLTDQSISVRSDTWANLFDDLIDHASRHPTSLVIDESPYLIEMDAAWASALQRSWDHARHLGSPCHLLLTLTGSAVATMTSIISSGGPLYERPTKLIRLSPFDLPTAWEFIGTPSAAVTIEAYAATGGYPLLLRRWDPNRPAVDNLIELAGDPVGALATNASVLLLDLPDTGGHHRVLSAIGRGATKSGEIANLVGQRTERSIDILERSGFISRRYPIGEPRRGAVSFDLEDGYLRFWFSVVERDLQLIEGGQGEAVIRGALPAWSRHVEDTFERQARAHAIALVRRGELPQALVGEWWTHRPTQAQVDVVGVDRGNWVFAGEAKWKDTFGVTDLRAFERSVAAGGDRGTKAQLAVWSKSQPTAEVAMLRPRLTWFGPDEMTAG